MQGAGFPLPYGGKPPRIKVDLNPDALFVVTVISPPARILFSPATSCSAGRTRGFS